MNNIEKGSLTAANPLNLRGKDSKSRTQQQILVEDFKQPKTMFMADKSTGIMRSSICKAVYLLEKAGRIRLIRKGHCEVTGYTAGYYTSDPALFPAAPTQLTLSFREEGGCDE